MTQPMRPSPDSLLAHEPFVRAVVRDLLRDEHRVQDVLQETWIRALDKGPGEGGSLKGWLASVARRLALDQHRSDARRERRERETARGEALESVDALHARLEAQREVVDAVLALEEPYKSVVLLAYYEQLAPQAIGERLGRSAATVRSQLSRAHEILKRRLDAHHGGDRSAWAGVLLPWAVATKSKAGMLVAAGIGVTLLGAGAWMLPRMAANHASESTPLASTMTVEPTALHVEVVSDPAVSARESLTAQALAHPAVAGQLPDVSTLGLDQLRTLAVQAMRVLEAKVLMPDPKFIEQNKVLLAMPKTGIARILARTAHGSTIYEGLVFPRQGGAYFSFATLSHDYDREPDLEYQGGNLSSGFYGAMVGIVLPIGEVSLTNLEAHASSPPANLPRARLDAWRLMFALPETDDIPGARRMQEQVDALRLGATAVRAGETYLVRTWSPDEHDQLVGVRVLDANDESVTISWRVLAQYAHANEPRYPRKKPEFADVPAAPAWIDALSVGDLVSLLHSIRKVSEPILLSIDSEVRASSAWLHQGAESSSGWFRVLPEDEFGPLLEVPGKGAYYSIDRRAYVEYYDADLGMPFGQFSAGVAGGNIGWTFDLGDLSRDEISGVLVGEAPRRFTGADLDRWNMLWETKSVLRERGNSQERGVNPEDFARADELRLRSGIKPRAGRSFLLRSILTSGTDQLLLMTALETSKDGTSFSWRELKRFDR